MGNAIYPVPDHWAANALIDEAGYQAMYARSIADPDAFWAEAALPRSSSEATPCNGWRFRSAHAVAAASGLKIQGLSTTWRR
jgi:hypothetical protein